RAGDLAGGARREPGPGEVPSRAQPLRADAGSPVEPPDPSLSGGPGDGLPGDLPARRRDEPSGGRDRRPLCLSDDRAAARPGADRPGGSPPRRPPGRAPGPHPRPLSRKRERGAKRVETPQSSTTTLTACKRLLRAPPDHPPCQPRPQPLVGLPAGEEIAEHLPDAGKPARQRHHPLPHAILEELIAGAHGPSELSPQLPLQPLRIPLGLAGEQVLRRPGPRQETIADPLPGQRIGHGGRIAGEQHAAGEPPPYSLQRVLAPDRDRIAVARPGEVPPGGGEPAVQ